jgi:exopolysaccharide biosynthesis polyprenyl glycosylphosphotransferase
MALKLALFEALAVFAALSTLQMWTLGGHRPLAGLAAWAVTTWTVTAFYYAGLYDIRRVRSFGAWAHRLPSGRALALLPLLAGHALVPGPALPRGAYLCCLLTALALLAAARASTSHLLGSRPLRERVLIVGSSWLARQLVREIHARSDIRQRVVGVIDDNPDGESTGWHGLGGLEDINRVVAEVRPHRVILALSSRRGRMPLKTLLDLRVRGVAVEDGAEVYERLTGRIAIEALTPSSLIFGRAYRAFRLDLVFGRALSLPASALALLLFAPLLALIALAIKLDSTGPVLFVHERVGRGGRTFRLLKFRTMRPATAATSEWARDNAGRLTRVGRWLRAFRLDELPQLVNILRGDMNLVGPRPHPVSNFPLFVLAMRNTPDCGEQIPYYALRSLVRPGITGWAQVRYRYANDLCEEIEKMKYDLYYVKHMSLKLDLQILLETVKIVLRGRESAPAPAPRRRELVPLRAPAVALLAPTADGEAR